jgi:hypothetical protein
MRQSQRRQHQEQVHLGDAELEVLAPGAHLPLLRGEQAALLEHVLVVRQRKQTAPVHPGAEVGRYGHVRRGGDDAVGQRTARPRDLVEHAAEAGLRRRLPLGLELREGGDRYACGLQSASPTLHERHLAQVVLQHRRRHGQAREAVPFLALIDALARPQLLHLRLGHQTGMVVLVALEGQPEALDGVGDVADRLIGRGGRKAFQDRLQVMAAEVGHQARQLAIVVPAHDGERIGMDR